MVHCATTTFPPRVLRNTYKVYIPFANRVSTNDAWVDRKTECSTKSTKPAHKSKLHYRKITLIIASVIARLIVL
jgi:hypothetical protein